MMTRPVGLRSGRPGGNRQVAELVASRGGVRPRRQAVEQLRGLPHGLEALESLAGPAAEPPGSGLRRIGVDRPPAGIERAPSERPRSTRDASAWLR